jgi:hypothetical protein
VCSKSNDVILSCFAMLEKAFPDTTILSKAFGIILVYLFLLFALLIMVSPDLKCF